MTYPILSTRYKSKKFIAIFWTIAAPYILVAVPTALVVVSNFGQFQVMLLLINVMIFISLTRWQVALVILPLSIYCAVKVCEFFANIDSVATSSTELQIVVKFKVIYTLVLICGIIIAFLKPKQEEKELSEEMIERLEHQLTDQEAELSRATSLKDEFLRNLQHETNTPLTGMCSMSQALSELYDKLTDKERKRAINTIAKSSNRLISYVNNLVDVSKLTNRTYNLNIRKVNLSNIVHEAIRSCKKLYRTHNEEVGTDEAGDERDFILNIEPNISAKCDEYYISRAIENIIINAIQYCKKGAITITLAKNQSTNQDHNDNGNIIFSVRDEGIGIPKEDFSSIFEPFVTSTKTRTPAGGRGVGLALVKKVAQMHKGTVSVESSERVGSLFTIILPKG
jgi:signal transduction histidine kinase